MKIGELSALTGASVRSLRHYEAKGLIASERTPAGYREYSPLVADAVRSIRLYLDLGLTTDQIAGILTCVLRNKEAFCAEVVPLYESKLAEIEREIGQLTRIKENLQERMAAIRAEQAAVQPQAVPPEEAKEGDEDDGPRSEVEGKLL